MPANSRSSLLVVDDDEMLRRWLTGCFRPPDWQVEAAGSGAEALALANNHRFDVALLDLQLPDLSGIELLSTLKELNPALEVLMLTAFGSMDTAIEAMKRGAYDYLVKPIHREDLALHVAKALEKARLTRRERQWVEQLRFESPRYRLVGSSPQMKKILQLIERIAPSDATVLVRGTSGTGKELVARALHFNSPRSDRPMVTINCAALQETLLESELFGHEKGAFTGAQQVKKGLIEVAEGGTLFIDEVAEMAPGLQAKLLRVLEDGHFRRVGSTQELHADIRLVAATNKPLEEELKAGRFREDLFHRLNVITLFLPPLKDRRQDIPMLIEHFLSSRQVGPTPFQIDPEAMEALCRYDWPGNIRELANVLERAQILAENHSITLDDLPDTMNVLSPFPSDNAPAGGSSRLVEVERRHVLSTLNQTKGNKVQAAKILGISRRALYRLIQKHHLEGVIPHHD